MTADTTMILFLNADQTTALYDLQVSLYSIMVTNTKESLELHGYEIKAAIELYRRVMCPTYEPEKN